MATLVLGIVSMLLPVIGILTGGIGLIVGLVGLMELRERSTRGLGMIGIGMVLCAVAIAFWLAVLTSFPVWRFPV